MWQIGEGGEGGLTLHSAEVSCSENPIADTFSVTIAAASLLNVTCMTCSLDLLCCWLAKACKSLLLLHSQIFPHHENEIAQSQACACEHDKQHMETGGTDFVRFWLHNGFVNGRPLADDSWLVTNA